MSDPGGLRPRPDPAEHLAREELRTLFAARANEVFYSRQLELLLEDHFFHWITHRALKDLVAERFLRTEARQIAPGGPINLYWHAGYRYYRRRAARVVELIRELSQQQVGESLGYYGESLVLDGFARHQFVMLGRKTRAHRALRWDRSEHDLDFIFARDGLEYGIEVKNTLSYIDQDEMETKISICAALGLRPVFVVRMLPQIWISDLARRGGFALILKYQLYPPSHRALAYQLGHELGLPVGWPRSLEEGTMGRFLQWHERNAQPPW